MTEKYGNISNAKQEALIKIHARSILISNEILTLLKSGYVDAAYSRWRSLYELVVISYFLSRNSDDVSRRYLERWLDFCREYPAINFTVPGMSIDDFTSMYYIFKVKREDAEEAFMMALKNGLIKPIMEFRNRMRYALADDALKDLVFDLYSFHKIEKEFCYEKWNSISTPTEEEQEERKIFYSDKKVCEQFFNRAEINRLISKKSKKQSELSNITNELVEIFQVHDNLKNKYFKCIKEKYEKTIKEYAFLLDEIREFWKLA